MKDILLEKLIKICEKYLGKEETEKIIKLKVKIEINKAVKMVEERNIWLENNEGKPPAMSYFEALGTRMCVADIKSLAKNESDLKRFKNAYESTQEKMNALKKKMESIKFEEM